jgi:hypothetical protein
MSSPSSVLIAGELRTQRFPDCDEAAAWLANLAGDG